MLRVSPCLLALLLLREAAEGRKRGLTCPRDTTTVINMSQLLNLDPCDYGDAAMSLSVKKGATFFHQYGTEHVAQICNESFRGDNAAWWIGEDGSSLLKFEPGYCNSNEIFRSKKSNHEKCPNNVSLSNFTSGGIFACKTPMEHQNLKNKNPLFSSKDDCMNFNFFFVAIIKSPAEQSSENIHTKAEEKVFIGENQNLTLSCAFELGKNTTIFAVYWFKEINLTKCLFSASNEGCHTPFNISYDVSCCIDDAFRDRRINSSTSSGDKHRNQTHVVTITNSTMADNGSYFCVVAAYNNGYTWTIEHRVSVNVTKASPPNFYLKIALAAMVGALLLMGGILLLLCCKKKRKGKPLENQQRDQTTVATEDCSPYAVSSPNARSGQETVYSLATSPGEAPPARCFSSQSKPAPVVQHGGNVEVLYSKVSKDRNGPSLASDSSV